MINEILKLIKEIKSVKSSKNESSSINDQIFFLKNDNILALRNPIGDSRFPYTVDGLTLWAYASGNISINQSNFFIIPPTVEGKEPYINFYGGINNKNNKYDVFSLTGNSDTELGMNEETYTIFNPSYCYYIRVIKGIIFATKLTVTKEKKIICSVYAINKSRKEVDVFSSLYFNPLLIHSSVEDEETKWFRTVKINKETAYFSSIEDLSREIHLNNFAILKAASNGDYKDITTRRMDYVGDKNRSISQSINLRNGCFVNHLPSASFTDMAIYGDIVSKHLLPGEYLESNYQVTISFNKMEDDKEEYNLTTNEKLFNESFKKRQTNLKIHFSKLNDYNLDNELFNNFLKSVIEQVDYGSKTKNSSLMLLGIRDVYQMMEASLIWDKENARNKILESLSYLDPSGRAPRQYAKESKGDSPLLDNREFIDQGQWIISTIYKYLAFTNDYSILNEECGYCKLIGRKAGEKLEEKDTVYDHLIKIINFLTSNIDKSTNCLKANYGDWNDAVDGLGLSDKEAFGNGVSVMATCHLYQNLHEMEEIRKIYKDKKDPHYLKVAEEVEQGILNNAIVSKGNERKIVHGWGDNKSFYVGSYDDVDHKSRYSSTSHSFFVLSGLYNNHKDFHKDILKARDALDSKYGLLTFDQYFDKKDAYKVGRIVNLPKGTAENGATYIHAGMFYVRALFQMNEGKLAFDQIYKLIPITHKNITTSPFVMPNSYGDNQELGIDGESMSDWYTGSSNTLLKAIIFDMFGIKPQIGDVLEINPTNYFPSDEVDITLPIKGKTVTVKYQNKHSGERKIYVNDVLLEGHNVNLKKYRNKVIINVID